MRNDFQSNYLMHHGILGMKWGIRNGPPYPLGSEDYSTSEKKALRGVRNAAGAVVSKAKKTKNVLKSDSGSRKSKALKEAREKDIDKMTIQELRDTNARLREEKSYQELTKGNIAEGRRFVSQLEKNIAAGIITGIAIEAGKGFVKTLPKNMPLYWTTLVRILSKL